MNPYTNKKEVTDYKPSTSFMQKDKEFTDAIKNYESSLKELNDKKQELQNLRTQMDKFDDKRRQLVRKGKDIKPLREELEDLKDNIIKTEIQIETLEFQTAELKLILEESCYRAVQRSNLAVQEIITDRFEKIFEYSKLINKELAEIASVEHTAFLEGCTNAQFAPVPDVDRIMAQLLLDHITTIRMMPNPIDGTTVDGSYFYRLYKQLNPKRKQ